MTLKYDYTEIIMLITKILIQNLLVIYLTLINYNSFAFMLSNIQVINKKMANISNLIRVSFNIILY